VRQCDILACVFAIVTGLVWFAAAEVVYDGSLMEDPFLRSGMFAQYYVPLATMYLVKVIRGEKRGTGVIAWLLSFLVLWAMIAVDVWVTHFKPNCDYCCIPSNECLMMESVAAIIITALTCIADVFCLRLMRKVMFALAGLWIVRRTMRVAGTALLTWLLCMLSYWVVYITGRTIRFFMQ